MFIVVIDVVMRYAFNSPLSWSYELISMYLMVIIFFFALSNTLNVDGHIAVDIFQIKMSVKMRHWSLAIGYWLSLVVFILIFWESFLETWSTYINKNVTDGLIQWPLWLSWISVPIGVLLLLFRILFRALGHTLSALSSENIVDLPLISGHEKE